ncbi:MAG: hypothetical protein J2P21_22330 [Chloracidobacterium sp.]|nr:hypothetical protein [Chloracidobacterium sp.]
MSLLRNLSGEDWSKPTAAREWTVKDVVFASARERPPAALISANGPTRSAD